jgi:hypothetical protein
MRLIGARLRSGARTLESVADIPAPGAGREMGRRVPGDVRERTARSQSENFPSSRGLGLGGWDWPAFGTMLIKELAKAPDLTEDQIKRICGLK